MEFGDDGQRSVINDTGTPAERFFHFNDIDRVDTVQVIELGCNRRMEIKHRVFLPAALIDAT
jgi:hypothetical protein